MNLRIGSLFSGAAGLDAAVCEVFGGEVVWHSEVDPAASKVLDYRFPGVPNHGDITRIDWAAVEPVDILCGGFPCQDLSCAGRRAGIKEGTRSGLWALFADAIYALRPSVVVIENVRGLLSAEAHRDMESADTVMGDGPSRPVLRAAGAVLGDLSNLGYDAQWTTISAASVGAPHRRERVFIVAVDADADQGGWGGWREASRSDVGRHDEIDGGWWGEPPAGCGGTAANPSRDGWHEGRPESAWLVGGPDVAVGGDGTVVTLAVKASRDSQWGKYAPAIRRWENVTRPAPSPTEPNRNGNPRLNPAFSEWMMGWPDGWVTAVPGISRNDQLRIVGNGVVPQCASAALRFLLAVERAA